MTPPNILATHFPLQIFASATGTTHKARSYVFGTLVEITICSADYRAARHLAATVLEDFDRLHWMLHAWKESDLVKLNRAIAAGERAIAVKPELAQLIRHATAFSARSNGLFNPAIGALVGLWNFHASEFTPAAPDPQAIQRVLDANPGMTDLRLENNIVICKNRSVQLDFGGFAKGYALDRAVSFLRRHELAGALVNIGGNIMATGKKQAQPWHVGIQHPRKPRSIALLPLHDGEAISTSGDYERYFMLNGKRYSHLIDPRSGWPACGAQSVTVLMPRVDGAGTRSDASSGPLFIHGAAGWREFAERLDVSHAMLIDERGDVQLTDQMRERVELSVDC